MLYSFFSIFVRSAIAIVLLGTTALLVKQEENADRFSMPYLTNGKKYTTVGAVDMMVIGDGSCRHSVFARLYYPSIMNVTISKQDVEWLPKLEYWNGAAEYANMPLALLYLFREGMIANIELLGRIATPSSHQGYPIIIFSHDLAAASSFYSAICISLANYGFMVASIEHRDGSASWTYTKILNGTGYYQEMPINLRKLQPNENELDLRRKQLRIRCAEMVTLLRVLENLNYNNSDSRLRIISDQQFEWSQFQGKLNLYQVTTMGHGFGGLTAIETLAYSTKIKLFR